MTEFIQSRWIRRIAGRCSRLDVVEAFRAVDQEIRSKYARFVAQGMTLSDACELGRRIRDQRELIHQIMDKRNRRHARRLLQINKRHRRRLLSLAREASLDTTVLIVK